MKVLLTNDDGIYAEGLWTLYDRFVHRHEVTVVAPDRERSAVGHAITLLQPLRATRVSLNGRGEGYAVNGTPADCIKLGILEILSERPDLVVAGMNVGANVGVHLNYSGTVAAAKEAALCGLIGIAVSIEGQKADYCEDAAGFMVALAEMVLQKGLPFGTFLNVNIPNLPLPEISGIQISRQGVELLAESLERRVDPRNRTYYWQGRERQSLGNDPEVDVSALNRNYISITPVKCDMTDYGVLEDMKSWKLEKPAGEGG
jgi:5'-nucleotidase